jgi:translocon-associated protein subunit beta
MKSVFVLCALLVGFAVSGDVEESPAKLLISKKILNNFLVEGRDVVVQYGLYNIGKQSAVNVRLNDANFPADDFEVVAGQATDIRFDRLGPGSNVSHTVVLRPKSNGYYNFTVAQVTYLPSEEAAEVRFVAP